MSKKSYQPEESLGFMSVTAHRLLNSTLRRKLKESGVDLTPEQWGVLVLLWEREKAAQDEIAAVMCVDKSSMSRVLSIMEDRGLITRTVNPANERQKVICATEESLMLKDRGFEAANWALDKAASGVAPQDIRTCIRVLATVKENLR